MCCKSGTIHLRAVAEQFSIFFPFTLLQYYSFQLLAGACSERIRFIVLAFGGVIFVLCFELSSGGMVTIVFKFSITVVSSEVEG